MQTILATDNIVIEKYDTQSIFTKKHVDADYVICQVNVDNSKREKELIDKGFVFLDRILLIEISLLKFKLNSSNVIHNVKIIRDSHYSEDMNYIAKDAYKTDRRFHLEYVFDSQKAEPIIDAYIKHCQLNNMVIYKAIHEDVLLGYTIVDEKIDKSNIYFENVLGVTIPGIKGKMIAPMLYGSMLSWGQRKFKKYIGRVSSSNALSINLHFQLGGKVTSVYDEYIYRANKQKGE